MASCKTTYPDGDCLNLFVDTEVEFSRLATMLKTFFFFVVEAPDK